ncbi:MAG: IclR family transcriptional regulator [Gaiellales bacterium]
MNGVLAGERLTTRGRLRLYNPVDIDARDAGSRRSSPGIHAALSVVELLVARAPLSLSDIAQELGLAKSTLHRVCGVLVERGWVVRDQAGRFELGIRALGVGARAGELPIMTAFRGVAPHLLTRHDETVCLAAVDGDESVFVAVEETSQPVRLMTHVGSRTPAFASASGRIVLAARPVEAVTAEYGGRPLVTPTGRRLRGVSELHEILADVRRNGYAENHQETAIGLYSASVPVTNQAGVVLAALTMCVPTSRMTPERRLVLLQDLQEAGARLSADVAWLPAYNARRGEGDPR